MKSPRRPITWRISFAPPLSWPGRKKNGGRLYFKLENEQPTGSFKIRGAFSKILATQAAGGEEQLSFIAASTGNHGAAVAHAARAFDCKATVCVPVDASPAKLAKIQKLEAEILVHGSDCIETEAFARALAEERGSHYVSPYNDKEVMAGQGTIADELVQQFAGDPIDVLVASVGGGGLIGGIGTRLEALSPHTHLIGVSPENSTVMMDSIAAGRIVPDRSQETLSDGTAGGMEPDSITLPICSRVIDTFTAVPEDEIAEALRWFVSEYDRPIEGAAAVAIAGYWRHRAALAGHNVVIVICGGNIDHETLQAVMAGLR